MSKWKSARSVAISMKGRACRQIILAPVCREPAAMFEKLEEAPAAASKYAGTQTEKNLQAAFPGESQARNKYTYFSSVAQKEGYEQMPPFS